MAECEISDFTVVSNWERVTAELESLLRQWLNVASSEPRRCGTVVYKKVPLEVRLVEQVERIPVLQGIEHYAVASSAGSSSAAVARAFGVDRFLLVHCGEESFMSMSTARAILSSALQATQARSPEPLACFVEYGEGDIFGVCAQPQTQTQMDMETRYSLRGMQLDELKPAVWPEFGSGSSPFLLVHQLLAEKFGDIAGNVARASGCFDFSVKPPPPPPLAADAAGRQLRWGCDQCIETFNLQTIYPQLEPALFAKDSLPDPWLSPIWMLSVMRRAPQPTRLAGLLAALAQLAHAASQPQESTSEPLHSRTRMHQVISPCRKLPAPPGESLQLLFFSRKGTLASRIALGALRCLQGASGSASHVRARLFKEFALFWHELVDTLNEYWRSRVPLPDTLQAPDLGSTLLEQKLAMLNYCICRGAAAPEAAAGQRSVATLLDTLAEKHRVEGVERRREFVASLQQKGRRLVDQLSQAISTNDLAQSDEDCDAPTAMRDTRGNDGTEGGGGDALVEDGGDTEEFFDPLEELPNCDGQQARTIVEALQPEDAPAECDPPGTREGHRLVLNDLRLLGDDGEPVWVPFTQVDRRRALIV